MWQLLRMMTGSPKYVLEILTLSLNLTPTGGLGQCHAICRENTTFFVVKEAQTLLLVRKSAELLGLITLVNAVITGPELTWKKLKELYP